MRTVYCIAFRGDRFLMVYNPKREGWEMPGGKVEEGESDLQAVRREFREEAGRKVLITGSMETSDGRVFSGEVCEAEGEGEMKCQLFAELPDRLAFPRAEYQPLIGWARRQRDRAAVGGKTSSA